MELTPVYSFEQSRDDSFSKAKISCKLPLNVQYHSHLTLHFAMERTWFILLVSESRTPPRNLLLSNEKKPER